MLETEGYELIYDAASNRVTGVKAKGHDGTDSVSYTHLDVYKRQRLHFWEQDS